MTLDKDLLDQLKNLPDTPGVYIFKDDKNRPIYVGKALSLKKRVKSYFQKTAAHSEKTEKLISHIVSLEFLMTDSEVEALILEANLIKRHKPKYNVSLRDDKTYPFIAISLSEDFPKVFVARGQKRAGFKYFGPFTKVHAMRETLDILRKLFPLRTCSKAKFNKAAKDSSPCLYHHLKICSAPCTSRVSKAKYRQMVDEVISFLEGRYSKVISPMKKEMAQASAAQQYERAAALRDKIRAVEHVAEGQKMVLSKNEDNDYIAIAKGVNLAIASVLMVRDGALIGAINHTLSLGGLKEDVYSSFIKQYYAEIDSLPKLIFLFEEAMERELLETWLSKKKGRKVRIRIPERGRNKRLACLAAKNGKLALSFQTEKSSALANLSRTLLDDLKEVIGSKKRPVRIEAYDISTLMGKGSVASMVVFEDGAPLKRDYRRFKIGYDRGVNDVAMLEEVISRRFRRYQRSSDDPFSSFARLPDLILVDGGLPQLGAADKALTRLGLTDIDLISLAKKEEEIYTLGSSLSIKRPKDDPVLSLLIRVRDEAHRFALSYQKTLRRGEMLSSALDDLPGIGPVRKRALLSSFGTVENIIQADLSELETVLPKKAAQILFESLRGAEG